MRFTLSATDPLNAAEVLSLVDAKQHLRVTETDEDALISALTLAAVDWVERHCGVALAVRGFVWHGECLPAGGGSFELPLSPIVTVSAITYLDGAGISQTLASTVWRQAGDEIALKVGQQWPETLSGPDGVQVSFTAGHAAPATDCPALIAAVKLLLGHLFINREGVTEAAASLEIPFGVKTLCAPYRRMNI